MHNWNLYSYFILADDESETSPHDLEGNNSDLEFGNDETFHLKGHGSFTQMQVNTHDSEIVCDNQV